jgi:hypothetical protein
LPGGVEEAVEALLLLLLMDNTRAEAPWNGLMSGSAVQKTDPPGLRVEQAAVLPFTPTPLAVFCRQQGCRTAPVEGLQVSWQSLSSNVDFEDP